eukprot:11815202-Alexandrium_andersonii.AAC.1
MLSVILNFGGLESWRASYGPHVAKVVAMLVPMPMPMHAWLKVVAVLVPVVPMPIPMHAWLK